MSLVHTVVFDIWHEIVITIVTHFMVVCCHQTFYFVLWVSTVCACHFLNQLMVVFFSNSPISVFNWRLNNFIGVWLLFRLRNLEENKNSYKVRWVGYVCKQLMHKVVYVVLQRTLWINLRTAKVWNLEFACLMSRYIWLV